MPAAVSELKINSFEFIMVPLSSPNFLLMSKKLTEQNDPNDIEDMLQKCYQSLQTVYIFKLKSKPE